MKNLGLSARFKEWILFCWNCWLNIRFCRFISSRGMKPSTRLPYRGTLCHSTWLRRRYYSEWYFAKSTYSLTLLRLSVSKWRHELCRLSILRNRISSFMSSGKDYWELVSQPINLSVIKNHTWTNSHLRDLRIFHF